MSHAGNHDPRGSLQLHGGRSEHDVLPEDLTYPYGTSPTHFLSNYPTIAGWLRNDVDCIGSPSTAGGGSIRSAGFRRAGLHPPHHPETASGDQLPPSSPANIPIRRSALLGGKPDAAAHELPWTAVFDPGAVKQLAHPRFRGGMQSPTDGLPMPPTNAFYRQQVAHHGHPQVYAEEEAQRKSLASHGPALHQVGSFSSIAKSQTTVPQRHYYKTGRFHVYPHGDSDGGSDSSGSDEWEYETNSSRKSSKSSIGSSDGDTGFSTSPEGDELDQEVNRYLLGHRRTSRKDEEEADGARTQANRWRRSLQHVRRQTSIADEDNVRRAFAAQTSIEKTREEREQEFWDNWQRTDEKQTTKTAHALFGDWYGQDDYGIPHEFAVSPDGRMMLIEYPVQAMYFVRINGRDIAITDADDLVISEGKLKFAQHTHRNFIEWEDGSIWMKYEERPRTSSLQPGVITEIPPEQTQQPNRRIGDTASSRFAITRVNHPKDPLSFAGSDIANRKDAEARSRGRAKSGRAKRKVGVSRGASSSSDGEMHVSSDSPSSPESNEDLSSASSVSDEDELPSAAESGVVTVFY